LGQGLFLLVFVIAQLLGKKKKKCVNKLFKQLKMSRHKHKWNDCAAGSCSTTC